LRFDLIFTYKLVFGLIDLLDMCQTSLDCALKSIADGLL